MCLPPAAPASPPAFQLVTKFMAFGICVQGGTSGLLNILKTEVLEVTPADRLICIVGHRTAQGPRKKTKQYLACVMSRLTRRTDAQHCRRHQKRKNRQPIQHLIPPNRGWRTRCGHPIGPPRHRGIGLRPTHGKWQKGRRGKGPRQARWPERERASQGRLKERGERGSGTCRKGVEYRK